MLVYVLQEFTKFAPWDEGSWEVVEVTTDKAYAVRWELEDFDLRTFEEFTLTGNE